MFNHDFDSNLTETDLICKFEISKFFQNVPFQDFLISAGNRRYRQLLERFRKLDIDGKKQSLQKCFKKK